MIADGKCEADNSERGPVRAGLFLPPVGAAELYGGERLGEWAMPHTPECLEGFPFFEGEGQPI